MRTERWLAHFRDVSAAPRLADAAVPILLVRSNDRRNEVEIMRCLLSKSARENRIDTLNFHGFTLVELLVVVSIIAVLIAMLLPALSRARDAAVTAQCMSNMRQDGIAITQYIADWPGCIPPYRSAVIYNQNASPLSSDYRNYPFFWQYLPYLYQTTHGPSTWFCPADNLFNIEQLFPGEMRNGYPEMNSSSNPDLVDSYTFNFDQPEIGPNIFLYPAKLRLPVYWGWYNPGLATTVSDPSNYMVMMETAEAGLSGHNTDVTYFRWDHRSHTTSNVLFLDGHVEGKTAKEVLTPPGVSTNNENFRPPGFHSFWFGRPDATSQIFVTP
jgi:prepilin-type N-terminal cleavage/methylation domain-containing protein/prepilin-type processing-associated H-X9-DG protein